MSHYSKQMQTMEAGDHSKNGASPKSQMSKGNNDKTCVKTALWRFALLSLLLFTSVQSHAQKEGDKLQLNEPVSGEIQSLFLKAVAANDTTKMQMLLEHGASINFYNSYWDLHKGPTGDPLFTALDAKAMDAVKFLIKKDRRTLLTRYQYENWERKGLKYLIKFDLNGNVSTQASPLVHALSKGLVYYEILRRAIFESSDSDSKLNGTIKKQTLAAGNDLLSVAMDYEDKWAKEIISNLQANGFKFDKNVLNKLLLNKCLYLGANRDMCTLLLNLGADPNYCAPGDPNRTLSDAVLKIRNALHLAIANGDNELAYLLIEHGANVNIQTVFYSPLYLAVQRANNIDLIKFLLEKGANINYQGQKEAHDDRYKVSVLGKAREEYKEFLILQGAR
jgi:ankyrin repeat protein